MSGKLLYVLCFDEADKSVIDGLLRGLPKSCLSFGDRISKDDMNRERIMSIAQTAGSAIARGLDVPYSKTDETLCGSDSIASKVKHTNAELREGKI